MANRKVAAGFHLTSEDRYLLYRAYHAAFKACKAKGAMQEKARTYDERRWMRELAHGRGGVCVTE